MTNKPVARVYCDGGVVGPNPSPLGGVWAWRLCDADDEPLREASGAIMPDGFAPFPKCGNNLSELVAMLRALRELPDGWCGTIYTDSKNNISRWSKEDSEAARYQLQKTVPQGVVQFMYGTKKRLGKVSFVLLGGHPNAAELEAGFRKDGFPVSRHNVWCDDACNRVKAEKFDPEAIRSATEEDQRLKAAARVAKQDSLPAPAPEPEPEVCHRDPREVLAELVTAEGAVDSLRQEAREILGAA